MPSKDGIIGLDSIVVPPTDPLEQYLLDHENDLHMHERNEIDKVFFEQRPLLKHNFPIEIFEVLLHLMVILYLHISKCLAIVLIETHDHL